MDDPNAFDTRLGAYALVVDAGRALLAFWNGEGRFAGRWTLPGGGVDLHEAPAEGAVREVREETGYEVELVRLLGVDSIVIDGADRVAARPRPLKAVRVVYEARVVGGDLRHEVDGTTDEARWVPLDEIPALDRASLVDVGLALLRGA